MENQTEIEQKIVEETKIPGILAHQVLGGDTYFKIDDNVNNSKIIEHFRKLRATGFEQDLENSLKSTNFLRGVSGSVLSFQVTTDWMGKDATFEEKGTWIHGSLLIPYLSILSPKSLDYIVRKLEPFIDENESMRRELEQMAIKHVKLQERIRQLESNQQLTLFDTPFQEPEVPITLMEEVQNKPKEIGYTHRKVIFLEQANYYTPRTINASMKTAFVRILDSNDKSENCYGDLIMKQAVKIGMVDKIDAYSYSIDPSDGIGYMPSRQENAKFNRNNSPVYYVKFRIHSVEKIIDSLVEQGSIEPCEIVVSQPFKTNN